MGIQKVNSKVYTINAQVPRAKDGRGRSYATLFTDLRWKLWEEAQKSALAKAKYDAALWEAQRKSIADQIKQQRELIAKVKAGELEAQDAAKLARINYEKAMRTAQARQTIHSSTTTAGAGAAPELSASTKKQLEDTFSKAEEDAMARGGTLNDKIVAMQNSADNLLGLGGISADEAPLVRAEAVKKIVDSTYAKAIKNGYSPADAQELAASAVSKMGADYQEDYALHAGPANDFARRSSSVTRPLVPITDVSAPEIDVTSREDELKRLENELKSLIDEQSKLPAPSVDPLQRAREEFVTRIGVGNFGASPRRQRTQELYDEPAALQRAADIQSMKRQLQAIERTTEDLEKKQKIQRVLSSLVPEPVQRGDFLRRDVDLQFLGVPQTKQEPSQDVSDRSPTKDTSKVSEPLTEPLSSVNTERGDYRAKVIMDGAALAAKKKKFERIAKTKAADRPEHIRLVEELYNTNVNAGEDPIKPVYDEIARTYADDPKIRQAAHTYLFALDMTKKRKSS